MLLITWSVDWSSSHHHSHTDYQALQCCDTPQSAAPEQMSHREVTLDCMLYKHYAVSTTRTALYIFRYGKSNVKLLYQQKEFKGKRKNIFTKWLYKYIWAHGLKPLLQNKSDTKYRWSIIDLQTDAGVLHTLLSQARDGDVEVLAVLFKIHLTRHSALGSAEQTEKRRSMKKGKLGGWYVQPFSSSLNIQPGSSTVLGLLRLLFIRHTLLLRVSLPQYTRKNTQSIHFSPYFSHYFLFAKPVGTTEKV